MMSYSCNILGVHVLSHEQESIHAHSPTASPRGASCLLYELSIHKMSDTNDLMFRYVCDGVDGRFLGIYLTVQQHFF
jgi:hypothetical protein